MTTRFSTYIPAGGDWREYHERIAGTRTPVISRINHRTGEYIVTYGDHITERGFDAGKREQIIARSTVC